MRLREAMEQATHIFIDLEVGLLIGLVFVESFMTTKR
jgi:hypothetical protein